MVLDGKSVKNSAVPAKMIDSREKVKDKKYLITDYADNTDFF